MMCSNENQRNKFTCSNENQIKKDKYVALVIVQYQMQTDGKPRRILPRTKRLTAEEAVKLAEQMLSFNMAAERDQKGRSLAANTGLQVDAEVGMGNCIGGEARKRRSPSPCRCSFCQPAKDSEYFSVRFHLPEAWQLSRVQISEGQCEVCGKERRLRDLRRVSRRLFIGPEGQQDLWEDCIDDSRWERPDGDQRDGPRILYAEQEEDRGVSRMVCEEAMPTREELENLGPFPDTEPLYIDDSPVVESEPVHRETEASKGPLDMGYDWIGEDYFDDQPHSLLSELYSSP